jgi:hypothetical protein
MSRIRFLAVVELDNDYNVSTDSIFEEFQEKVENALVNTVAVSRATVSDCTVYFPAQASLDEDDFDKFVAPLEVEE